MAMALKILGSAEPASVDTYETLYTVPASTQCVGNILALNKDTAAKTIRVGRGDGTDTAPDNDKIYAYDYSIPTIGTWEKTRVCMTAGDKIFIRASSTSVNFIFEGDERSL